MNLSANNGSLSLEWGGLMATTSRVCLAHVGLKLLNTIKRKEVDSDRYDHWRDEGWLKSSQKACPALSESLCQAIEAAGLSGAVLWDTMRTGSDFWRPGNLLLRTADAVRTANGDLEIEYARDDEFCPPPDLLAQFRSSEMPFGIYADKYAGHLRAGERVKKAACRSVLSLARGVLPVFYCTDPYIPDYADPKEQLTGIPYRERKWLNQLRDLGCHRLVLVEEIVREFLGLGVPVTVLELDQSRGRVNRREYSPPDKSGD